MKKKMLILLFALCIALIYSGRDNSYVNAAKESIPKYSGNLVYTFKGKASPKKAKKGKIVLSELDDLGRCKTAYACLGKKNLPKKERGAIGHIRPSGWHTVKYNDLIEGNYLYNRCHLLAFCLTGINDDPRNLITGTRQLNVEGMLPYEEKIVKYIERTGKYVWYQVTPVYTGDNLVADGVRMQALSSDKKLSINVFVYNVQDGIVIDYKTGDSKRASEAKVEEPKKVDVPKTVDKAKEGTTYIINKNTQKFHVYTCTGVTQMKEKNKIYFTGTYDEAIKKGYSPCKMCLP